MRNHPDTKRALLGVALWAALVPLTGCLDALGYEDDVTESQSAVSQIQLEDDRIEDKHPTFDPARTVTETFDYCQVTLDKSATVTKLDIVPFAASESALDGKLFRGRTEALAAAATVASGEDLIPSMEVVNGSLKPFNDGLYAAVELAAENGNAAGGSTAPNKRLLLSTLLTSVNDLLATASSNAAERPAEEDAAVLLGAALILGGDTPAISADLASRAQARADTFTAEVQYASPIGFYTWTPALEKIFTRDRFLQNGDGSETFGAYAALAFVIGQDAALLADYQRATTLYTGLTNPFVSYPLDALIPYVTDTTALADPNAIEAAFVAQNPPRYACSGALLAFLPASRSKETAYFDATFCAGVPAGTNLLDALVAAIQSGAVDLTPGTDAGWYDYQEWALETLLLPDLAPEDQYLLLTASYKKKLVETFKSILIQDRETHVKQLAGATASSAEETPIDLYPLFPAEPFLTFYLRSARGYRFLRTFVESAMGTGFLDGTARLLETGAVAAAPLSTELDQRIQLLYGLYFLTADAVGMDRDGEILSDELVEIDPATAVTAAGTWLQSWRTDPDVARDPRVIVPLFDDNGAMHYSAVVGIKALKSRVEFVAGHEPVVTPTSCWTGKLVAHDYTLLVEETADVTLPDTHPPPTRDELRAICDAHATTDEIVQALQAL
jgi:hypothetical protein